MGTMKTGFHTNAFVWAGVNDLKEIAGYAADQEFDFLEVGPGIELNKEIFYEVGKIIDFGAFIYCRNFIDDDIEKAKKEQTELYKRMEFASEVCAKSMICSTGISAKRSLPNTGGCNPLLSLELAADFLSQAIYRAKELGLRLLLENCPMYRNIATSPLMWHKIFDIFKEDDLGLCYDASHFVWQFIDPYAPLEQFGNRIYHLHIKDTAIMKEKLAEVGIMHNTATERGFEENQWWRHCVIGDGEIDWNRFLTACKALPNNPNLSIEMEDYRYEGRTDTVKAGISLQLKRMKQIL